MEGREYGSESMAIRLNPLFQKLKIWKKEKYESKSLATGIKNAIKQGFTRQTDDYFEVMFNPESYQLTNVNQYSKLQGINTISRQQQYQKSKPQELSLTLILDGNGVTEFGVAKIVTAIPRLGAGGNDVYHQVRNFLELTSDMNGDEHKPNDLVLAWGNLVFECVLSKVDVKYTMFDRAGLPLRAELSTIFFGSIEDSKRVKKEDKKSPDLTRVRTIQAGDRLPLIASELYDNPLYYIELAKANGLNNFRQLKPGGSLRFPPVDK